MLYASIVLFAIAALIGLALAFAHGKGKPVDLIRALLHGVFAAIGLILLLVTVAKPGGAGSTALVSLIVLVVAALGGFVLFGLHASQKKLPIPLIVVHALIAATGLVILIVAAAAA